MFGLRRHFHVMRTITITPTSSSGMWGGVAGRSLDRAVVATVSRVTATIFQVTAVRSFYRYAMATIRTSLLTHDSQFTFGDKRDFPAAGCSPAVAYVGCDAASCRVRTGTNDIGLDCVRSQQSSSGTPLYERALHAVRLFSPNLSVATERSGFFVVGESGGTGAVAD